MSFPPRSVPWMRNTVTRAVASPMKSRRANAVSYTHLAEGHLARIEENTGTSASHLGKIEEEIRKINRDGVKCK